jgi:four helix bundle protein
MATFKRFEDIQAWQKARLLTKRVYVTTREGEFATDYDLRRQIRRSSCSIMANIAEGQGRRTDKDFANFINLSLGSVAETKSHFYLALDLEYISQTSFDELYESLDEIGRMLFSLSRHLRIS